MRRGLQPRSRGSGRVAVLALDLITDFDFPDGPAVRRALARHAPAIHALFETARHHHLLPPSADSERGTIRHRLRPDMTSSRFLSMRSTKTDKHAALWQAATITTLALAMTGFGIAGVRKPASAAELRIPIEELHSDVAELAFLRAERMAGHVSDTFYDAQLRQLGRTQADSYRELTRLQVRPTLMPLKIEAVEQGRALGRHLTILREGEDVDDAALRRVRDRLDSLMHDLRR